MNILNPKLWKTWLLAGLTLAVLLRPETAGATTRTVTTTSDGIAGSLRYLILASAANDTIDFAVTGTITLTNELPIGRNLTIIGPGANLLTVSGNNASRVFNITAGTVSVSGLAIGNGRIVGANGGSGVPGADAKGGGILNNGTLALSSCTLSGNSAAGGLGENFFGIRGGEGGAGLGGAVYSQAALALTNCTFSGNSATAGAGGFGNSGGKGGYANGGGAMNQGTLIVINCSFSGNSATGGNAGTAGIGSGGHGGSAFGGGVYEGGSGTYRNTVIAIDNISAGTGGSGSPAGTNGFAIGTDVDGVVSSQGHNLIGRTDGSSGWISSDLLGGATDGTKLNPLLGPLQDNGGPTFTMALLPPAPPLMPAMTRCWVRRSTCSSISAVGRASQTRAWTSGLMK